MLETLCKIKLKEFMGTKLSPEEAELYKRLDEILHFKWDPIGISGEPGARDEYYSYLSEAYFITQKNNFTNKLADYLHDVATKKIGVTSNLEHSQKIAKLIFDWARMLRKE